MGMAALRRLRSNSSSGMDACRESFSSDFLWEDLFCAVWLFDMSLLESVVDEVYELARLEKSLNDFRVGETGPVRAFSSRNNDSRLFVAEASKEPKDVNICADNGT